MNASPKTILHDQNPRYNPAIHHRRSIRLKGYDYSRPGAYFITLCTHHRQRLFGKVVNGEMVLNQLGEIVREEWEKSAEIRAGIELGNYVVMPNLLIALPNRRMPSSICSGGWVVKLSRR